MNDIGKLIEKLQDDNMQNKTGSNYLVHNINSNTKENYIIVKIYAEDYI